jgi:RepB DNA-primase from phage plasmid
MNPLEYYRSIQMAQAFLTRCFAPGEFIALLLLREKPVAVTQRVVLLERAIAPRYLGWLAHQNAAGANIYVVANPLRFGSRKRTKESVASVRHLYLAIDSDGEAKLAALQNSDTVPKPTAIISTSPNKYQVLWRVKGFDFEKQESTLKVLALHFWRRSRLYRLQPGSACAWLLRPKIQPRPPCRGPISRYQHF